MSDLFKTAYLEGIVQTSIRCTLFLSLFLFFLDEKYIARSYAFFSFIEFQGALENNNRFQLYKVSF